VYQFKYYSAYLNKEVIVKKRYLFICFLVVMMYGCSTKIYSLKKFSDVKGKNHKIIVFEFNNYTATPDAGKRAANIAVGVLQAKGYKVYDFVNHKRPEGKISDIKSTYGADFILEGGVSEWRYKTGIDGEPAVAIQLRLINTENNNVEWSSTGSTHSWGNSSIGSVALSMISKIFK